MSRRPVSVVLRSGDLKAWVHDPAAVAATCAVLRGPSSESAPLSLLATFPSRLLEAADHFIPASSLADVVRAPRERGATPLANRVNKLNIAASIALRTTTGSLDDLVSAAITAVKCDSIPEHGFEGGFDPWADAAAARELLAPRTTTPQPSGAGHEGGRVIPEETSGFRPNIPGHDPTVAAAAGRRTSAAVAGKAQRRVVDHAAQHPHERGEQFLDAPAPARAVRRRCTLTTRTTSLPAGGQFP